MKQALLFIFNFLFTIFFIGSTTFGLIYLIPGDPADFILKDQASLEERQNLRKSLGLDQPLLIQYKNFTKRLIKLDLGRSLYSGEAVFDLLLEKFFVTFNLAFFSLLLAWFWGIPLGILSHHERFKKMQAFFDMFPIIFISFPVFIVAPCLIWLFAVKWPLLPVNGTENSLSFVLPSISLALPLGAFVMKMTRTSVSEILNLDYIRTAQAKGVPPKSIYFKHILKNAIVPIITIIGLQLGALLAGAVIVEVIFDLPGMGILLYQSILSRDYPVIQGVVLYMAFVYVLINKFTDQVQNWIQPQMRDL